MPPTVDEAKGLLGSPDLERLKFCFEQGTPAFAKVPRHDGWFVGVHMDGLPFMDVVAREGVWGIGRKQSA